MPGTEITIPYEYTTTWISREKVLTLIIGGPCDCVMCISERADGEDSYGLWQMLIEDMEIARLAEQVHIKRLVSTYRSDQSLPQAPLFAPYFYAMQSMDRGAKNHPDLLKSSIRMGFEALKAAGFTGIDTKLTGTMVQFTYVPLTLCKLFPTLKRIPEFISSCRNVHIDHTSTSSRGIFNWVKIEGEKGF